MGSDGELGDGELGLAGRRAGSLDLWVVAGWWLLVVLIGFARADYTGDGLRHLPPIIEGVGPRLGEPRWLLFPGFLYALLRPFVVLGVAKDVGSLAHVMMALTVIAGGAYMLALRACLVAARVDGRHRAAALALAGASAGIFFPSADLMEPIFGATIVLCGLAWAARRAHVAAASAGERRRALLVAVAAIAVAALMYQGLILALGLVPLVIPRATLRDRRAQILSLLIAAVVPVVIVGSLVAVGNSVPHALGRALQGEENHFYSSMLKKTGVMARIVPIVAGPPQGIVALGDFRGFNGLIASLRGGAGRRAALETLAMLGFSMLVIWVGVVGAARRRDVAVLLAFASLLVLPVVRCQQYGYLKFYILLAVVVAFAAARERPGVVALVALVVVSLNAGPILAGLPASRRSAHERAAIYAEAGPSSCWLTTAWIPAYSFRWPGRICAVLGSLAGARGETDAEVLRASAAAMTSNLEACFCASSSVLTDDMTEPGGPLVAASAQQFHYTAFDLQQLILPVSRAEVVSPPGSTFVPVYRYPAAEQRRVCASLAGAQQARP